MSSSFEWSTRSGDAWAERWRQIDRALEPVGAALIRAALERVPSGPFDALDIGCGAGATSISLASRTEAQVLGCDLSPSLIEVAKERAAGLPSLRFVVGDAVEVAAEQGPFDLFLSRHGVMFFADPPGAFRTFRAAARDGATLVFSCFRGWEENAWASELASAAAGRQLPPPGREPSGFAFADPEYVRSLLLDGGWTPAEPQRLEFGYIAADGAGAGAVDAALGFLGEIGPASAVLRTMEPEERAGAIERMRATIERYCDGNTVRFPAAAWIWRARA